MTNETPPPPCRRSLRPLPPMPPLEDTRSWRDLVETRIDTVRPGRGSKPVALAALLTVALSDCATTRPPTMTDVWQYGIDDHDCVDANVGPAIHACREKLWRDTCARLDPPCPIQEPKAP